MKCANVPEGEQCGTKKGRPVQGCVPRRSTVSVQAGDQPSLFMLVVLRTVAGLGRCHKTR